MIDPKNKFTVILKRDRVCAMGLLSGAMLTPQDAALLAAWLLKRAMQTAAVTKEEFDALLAEVEST